MLPLLISHSRLDYITPLSFLVFLPLNLIVFNSFAMPHVRAHSKTCGVAANQLACSCDSSDYQDDVSSAFCCGISPLGQTFGSYPIMLRALVRCNSLVPLPSDWMGLDRIKFWYINTIPSDRIQIGSCRNCLLDVPTAYWTFLLPLHAETNDDFEQLTAAMPAMFSTDWLSALSIYCLCMFWRRTSCLADRLHLLGVRTVDPRWHWPTPACFIRNRIPERSYKSTLTNWTIPAPGSLQL